MSAVQTYQFTTDWVSRHTAGWKHLFHFLVARNRMLEIGSFEGRSACWFLQNALSPTGTLYCLDTWEGSTEFKGCLPDGAASRSFDLFERNIAIAKGPHQTVNAIKGRSLFSLAELIAQGHELSFDVIYIDGSHHSMDTLTDACMAWPLLKQGGMMIFDDYLFNLRGPIEDKPKPAIDAFLTMFSSRLLTLMVGDQYAVRKTQE